MNIFFLIIFQTFSCGSSIHFTTKRGICVISSHDSVAAKTLRQIHERSRTINVCPESFEGVRYLLQSKHTK